MNSMPPLLLQDFLNRVFAGIDGAAAGEAAGGLVGMVLSLEVSDKESGLAKSLSALGSDFGRAYTEAAGPGALTARLEAWMAGAAEKASDPVRHLRLHPGRGQGHARTIPSSWRTSWCPCWRRPLRRPRPKARGQEAGQAQAGRRKSEGGMDMEEKNGLPVSRSAS